MGTTNRLLSNFLSLSGVQIANYVLPIITIPYLVRVLGPERYGLIVFAQAFIAYFSLITDYGFNLSANREVSIHRENREKVSDIFMAVLFIKSVLMVASFLILCVAVFCVDRFRGEWLLYVLTFGMVLGNFLFPTWFLSGMERMREVAILNIISKVIFTVAVFVFIHSRDDYLLVALINSCGFIIAGLLGLWVVTARIGLKIGRPSVGEIKHQLTDGWQIFISTIAMNLYTTTNTFILGIFTNNAVVGYYGAGEKVTRAVQGLLSPLSQTIYPHVSKLASESRDAALRFVRKIVKLVGAFACGLSLLLLIFAQQIGNIILGSQFSESVTVIRILSFLPLIGGLGNVFGIQVMLNFGLKHVFTRILVIASFISVFLALILVVPLEHIGISISILSTELFITTIMFAVLWHNGLRVI